VPASVLYMSMSLDGYIAGPNDDPGNPGGDGFDRLHEWITTPDGEYGRPSGPAGELFDEWDAAGAVLAGRRTVEQVDHWGGDHHGVPIFVPSHRPPGSLGRGLSVGDLCDRWDRQRDGTGEGRRRGPQRAGAGRLHRATGA
jgi:dihydrofolate reductase